MTTIKELDAELAKVDQAIAGLKEQREKLAAERQVLRDAERKSQDSGETIREYLERQKQQRTAVMERKAKVAKVIEGATGLKVEEVVEAAQGGVEPIDRRKKSGSRG